MIGTEQIKDLQERVLVLGRCIDVEAKRADVAQRTERTLAADFWDDPKSAEKFLKELAGVKFWVTGYDKVHAGVEDLNVLLEFEDFEELETSYAAVLAEVEALELRNMLGEEGDNLVLFLPSTPVQVELRRTTGRLCLCVCTSDGLSEMATR